MDSLREKLNDPKAVNELAALGLDVTLNKPVTTLLPRELVLRFVTEALKAWSSTPSALQSLERSIEQTVTELKAEPRALKTLTPMAAKATLRDVVSRPVSFDRKLVLTIIDREPTRELVRALLLDFVLEFGRKASAPVAGVAKGLGTFAKLAGEAVKSRAGTLGSIVGAVGGEVERQMEKRAVEFVDAALSGVFGQLADAVSDPRRAAEAAELRLAMLDGALELTGPQLARELANGDVPGAAKLVQDGVAKWLATPEAQATLERAADFITRSVGTKTGRELLTELGLLEVVRSIGSEWIAVGLRDVIASEAFAAWAGR